jgi:ketosteroid isomerase-like protein
MANKEKHGMLKNIFRIIFLVSLLAANLSAQAADASAETGDEAIHEQLRALLHNIETAVNAQQYDQLALYFDAKTHVTPSNQETLSAPDQLKPYFDKWFGPGRFLKSIQMTLTADNLTELNAAKDFGIVTGSSFEKYVLTDGRHYDLPTRWTATVAKGADGQWRISTLHIGVDFTDNPLLNEAKAAITQFAVIGVAGGLIIGIILGWLLGRRRSKA